MNWLDSRRVGTKLGIDIALGAIGLADEARALLQRIDRFSIDPAPQPPITRAA